MTTAASRHLPPSILASHIASGIEMVYPFPGRSDVSLLIEGSVPRLTLRAALASATPDRPSPLKNVALSSRFFDGSHRWEVAVSGADLILDGHAMLCAIADRIQLDGKGPVEATADTLEHWRSVIALRTRMPPETEIGLFGELLVVEALTTALGPAYLQAWRGPGREEHDLGLTDLDIEVKTTSAERRAHWISSLDQLQPSPNRPLLLLSLQITKGGQAGRTLPQLIAKLRKDLDRDVLDAELKIADWDDDAADLFVDRWHLRSDPHVYVVDGTFPALTRQDLASSPRPTQRITDVRYRVDLDDLPVSSVEHSILESTLNVLHP